MSGPSGPEDFEVMLTGGHPNSLGRTEEVVDLVLADCRRLEELYGCYSSPDEVVRLRVSNAMKRICRVEPAWMVPYLDRFIGKVSRIEQASAKWTLAQLFLMLADRMTASQREQATEVMMANLDSSDDWIVQNQTITTLGDWAGSNTELADWLVSRLRPLTESDRKSVAKRAARTLESLGRS